MRTPNRERVVLFTDPLSMDVTLRTSLRERIPDVEICEANSVSEFLSLVRERECDLTVLDYDMPGIPQTELLTRLRLLDNEPEVLLLSRCESPGVIKRIAESNKRYVVRDSQVVNSLSLAIRDLMRIRRLERETANLRANAIESNVRLQEQNDRLDDFCVTLAHDIRVPLSALSLKLECLLNSQGPSLPERGRSMLASSVDAVHHLLRVVEATYDVSRIDNANVSMASVDVKELAHRVASEVAVTVNGSFVLECDDIPLILGNETLLQQVFLNLMSNSIKYSNQPTPTVFIRHVRPTDVSNSSHVWIECWDNGPGIPRADQGQVFKMFKRGSNRGTKDGLGVGLAIVQRIVELHEGTVSCVAQGDQATCRLLLSLPRAM